MVLGWMEQLTGTRVEVIHIVVQGLSGESRDAHYLATDDDDNNKQTT